MLQKDQAQVEFWVFADQLFLVAGIRIKSIWSVGSRNEIGDIQIVHVNETITLIGARFRGLFLILQDSSLYHLLQFDTNLTLH